MSESNPIQNGVSSIEDAHAIIVNEKPSIIQSVTTEPAVAPTEQEPAAQKAYETYNDDFDIELLRINADGTVQEYQQNDLNIGKADKYEMDFGDWDGEGDMCFKDDEDGDGFDDEQCTEEPNEEPPGGK